jgi:phosphate binding protein
MSARPIAFGKYELVSRLASGGMAELFLARTRYMQGIEKQLVVKRIRRERTEDQEFVGMFLDEARVVATLDHPNVVHTYDVGRVDGEYYIAMEYVPGRNLVEVLRAAAKQGSRALPLEPTLSIVIGACAGLHHAHERIGVDGGPLHIVHRDVSLQNLMVTFDGVTKVIDFGIARLASHGVEAVGGTLKGNLGYMSPEQCRGGAIDRRSDLFSLGAVLYELTCGRRAFRERSDFETLRKITEGAVTPPSVVVPSYPPALEAIVNRCLEKDPDERYQTARELQSDLEELARDQRLILGSAAVAQQMERLFPEEAERRPAPSKPSPTESTSNYFGEVGRGTDGPLGRARRRHLLGQAIQAAATALVVAGALSIWALRAHLDPGPIAAASVASSATAPGPRAPVEPQPVIEERVVVKGSDTIGASLGPRLAGAFEASHRGKQIVWEGLGSKTAFVGLLDSSADLGASSRPITDDERREAERLGVTLDHYVIAHDGLRIVVHGRNPVRALTLTQLAGIFSGRTRRWSEVGGDDAPIVVVSRPSYSGTRAFFEEKVLRKGTAQAAAMSAGALIREHNQEIVDAVAGDPHAIGFVGLGTPLGEVRTVALSEASGERAVEPSADEIRAAAYPLHRSLYLYAPARPTEATAALIRFVLSPEGQEVVKAEGFIPVDRPARLPDPVPVATEPRRGAPPVRVYFAAASSRLEPPAKRKLVELADQATRSGARLLVVGHADSHGADPLNDHLARARGQAVAAYLRELAVPTDRLRLRSASADAPVASNETVAGRGLNRRVDVFVLPQQSARQN